MQKSTDRENRTYIAIDLKSFYASVECHERGLDPLTTNLVVADVSRTEKTICLAVSPSLKVYGIPGRARLFEVVQKVKEVNAGRLNLAPHHTFSGKSVNAPELQKDPSQELDYIAATPRMKLYMKYSNIVYNVYLKYIAPEDVHIYSVDEVFMDVTAYLKTYKMEAKELAMKMIKEVLDTTGITATAGIGSNLFLSKVAMDIVAKHIPPDENGVRIAVLDERSFREQLWDHRPLTDFWRIGRGISKKLEQYGMYTLGDVCRCSVGKENDYHNEALLYRLFGVNAELLIDHAWGYEPAMISDIKAYKPENNSLSSGQVLKSPYEYDKALLIIKEMADLLALDLVDKCLVCDQIVIQVGYDNENLADPERARLYKGEVNMDFYGRPVPKPAHGSINLDGFTSSGSRIMEKTIELFSTIVDKRLTVRRLNITANHVISEAEGKRRREEKEEFTQLSLFTDISEIEQQREERNKKEEREKNMQKAILEIKKRYGKNAVLRGMNFEEGATTIERNGEVGGHKG